MEASTRPPEPELRDVVVIGAGVSGIYQLHKLIAAGFDAIALEADDDLGGTWYNNRYPGCRFDSESFSYGYSFSPEVLDEWHWHEQFSSQPENLRYLNFVVDKFDLRPHMRFGARIDEMIWDESDRTWTLTLADGGRYRTRWVISCLGPLSVPTLPSFDGMDEFTGTAFHTFHWPKEGIELIDKRVGIIGTGATAIQIIPAIVDDVASLTVFQRRPNWSTPLNNAPIDDAEMAEIRRRYDDIFAACSASPGGFIHMPRRGFWDATAEERRALWDELYTEPGFAFFAANYAEIFFDEAANAEVSAYVAERIRQRVDDPAVADRLIPTDHGFGIQRLPLETNYFEAYNRDHVQLVSLRETPIAKVTPTGIKTTETHVDLDVIIYATGFDAITGAYDRIDIRGVDGQRLFDAWADGPQTYVGLLATGFPNLMMIAGPQSVSGSTNFPRAIEVGVDWVTDLLIHARAKGATRLEAEPVAVKEWQHEVKRFYERLLLRSSQGWFTGYNSNVAGHHAGMIRHQAYFGGAPRYAKRLAEIVDHGYEGIVFG